LSIKTELPPTARKSYY